LAQAAPLARLARPCHRSSQCGAGQLRQPHCSMHACRSPTAVVRLQRAWCSRGACPPSESCTLGSWRRPCRCWPSRRSGGARRRPLTRRPCVSAWSAPASCRRASSASAWSASTASRARPGLVVPCRSRTSALPGLSAAAAAVAPATRRARPAGAAAQATWLERRGRRPAPALLQRAGPQQLDLRARQAPAQRLSPPLPRRPCKRGTSSQHRSSDGSGSRLPGRWAGLWTPSPAQSGPR